MARPVKPKRFRRHLKIVTRKLGRHGKDTVGLFWTRSSLIEIDPRLTSFKRLETILHEAMHEYAPHWSEAEVRTATRALRDALWRDGYRRVANR